MSDRRCEPGTRNIFTEDLRVGDRFGSVLIQAIDQYTNDEGDSVLLINDECEETPVTLGVGGVSVRLDNPEDPEFLRDTLIAQQEECERLDELNLELREKVRSLEQGALRDARKKAKKSRRRMRAKLKEEYRQKIEAQVRYSILLQSNRDAQSEPGEHHWLWTGDPQEDQLDSLSDSCRIVMTAEQLRAMLPARS